MGDSIEKIIAEMRRVESNPRESHVLAAVVGSWADRLRALAPAPSEPTMAGGGVMHPSDFKRALMESNWFNSLNRCTCEKDQSITCIVHPIAKHPSVAPRGATR